MARDTYHHGDLRAVILDSAAGVVAAEGAHAVSLRKLARDAGVSPAAPSHHFGDRRGLFTALAIEGFERLADALAEVEPPFVNSAEAYVRFALEHPGHYSVMFDRALQNASDPALQAAEARCTDQLTIGVGGIDPTRTRHDPEAAATAAWCLVHGLATLWLNDAFDPPQRDEDPLELARRTARVLFGSSS